MTERERLIKLLNEAEQICDDNISCKNCHCDGAQTCVSSFTADYLLEHGVVIRPCKVGDTVYTIDLYGTVKEDVCLYLLDEGDGFVVSTSTISGKIGKRVFLKPEDAENALKERIKEYENKN